MSTLAVYKTYSNCLLVRILNSRGKNYKFTQTFSNFFYLQYVDDCTVWLSVTSNWARICFQKVKGMNLFVHRFKPRS